MNQEQNNLNPNNFNTQGNNGIPNNQPLNNQMINNNIYQNEVAQQSANINQQTFNPKPQPTPSFQQPIMQEPTPQPTSTFESGNTNNQNLNSKPPKKKNLGLIIGIIVGIVIVSVIIGIMVLSNKNGKSNGIGNINNNSTKTSNISQISITGSDIVALTNDGDLYYIGDEFSTFFDSGNEDYKDLKKVASNVEKFYNNNAAVYYIDKQQDLYYFGSSYNAGSSSEIEKDYSGAKDVNANMNFCGFIINKNDELYIKNHGISRGQCGLSNLYEDFTKVADNVKSTFIQTSYNGYISNNNELYLSTSNAEYKKIADNVKSVYTVFFYKKILYLTNDNKLYIYEFNIDNDPNNTKLELLRDDVEELGKNYFKTTNGEYNILFDSSNLALIKGETQTFGKPIYYGVLDAEDIKEILYYDNTVSYDFDSGKNDEKKKLIYLSTDNKIVLIDQNGKKKIAYNINTLNEIFEFVISKNLVEG